ncbi:MAG TPA: non-homologous end-joining DNA ligase [Acidobacteriaceae bacterium]|nr:non-homologous end-joining DNA ligase [Acidobacteriaceae bacterium]
MAKRDDAAEVAGVRLTHPERVLDAESRLTKLQLARYYAAVAEAMLPHVVGRPLSLVRCPEGSDAPCFYQRHAGGGLPEGVVGVPVKSKTSGKTEQYITVEDAKGLVGLAQMGVLEVHPWGARSDALETPDRLIFDLDPGEGIAWEQLVESAAEIRELLKGYDLESFVKWTGGKGLHVVAPIEPEHRWDMVLEFARDVARGMEARRPELYLTKAKKTAREEKIFLDYLRNERGGTVVAPYSPRARKGAHVAMPLRWEELETLGRPEFAVANFAEWKARLRSDPWKRMGKLRQRLRIV